MGDVRIYRELKVWQMGLALCRSTYEIVRKLPREETFALADQMRRSAVSVPANIAEGNARASTKAYANHVSIAIGSLAELDTLISIAEDLGYTGTMEANAVQDQIANLRRALHALRNALRARAHLPRTKKISA